MFVAFQVYLVQEFGDECRPFEFVYFRFPIFAVQARYSLLIYVLELILIVPILDTLMDDNTVKNTKSSIE